MYRQPIVINCIKDIKKIEQYLKPKSLLMRIINRYMHEEIMKGSLSIRVDPNKYRYGNNPDMTDNYQLNGIVKESYTHYKSKITYVNCYNRTSTVYENDIKDETIFKKDEFKNIFINSHGKYIPTSDTIQDSSDFSQAHYLFNTITYGDAEGGHWITILIHTFKSRKLCRIYYFDSCYEKGVQTSDIPIINYAIKVITETIRKNGYKSETIYCNKMVSQKYSFHCGIYCMFYSLLSSSLKDTCIDDFKSFADILEVSDEAMQQFKWLLQVEKIAK